jgi:hypothetical protein
MPESAKVVIAFAVHNLSRIVLCSGIRRRGDAFALGRRQTIPSSFKAALKEIDP